MVRLFIFLPIILFASCNIRQPKQNASSKELSSDNSVLDINKISQLNLESAREYGEILDALDKNNLNSIGLAIKLYKQAKVDSVSKDSMFADFNDFFALIANSYLENNNVLQNQSSVESADTTVNRIKTLLSDYGMNLTTNQGEYYLEPETEWLLKKFEGNLSHASLDFLTIYAEEQDNKYIGDGNLLVTQNELISRIIKWEDFIGKYPSFISIGRALDYYTQYLEAFLNGTENTNVFDAATKKLNDKTKSAFEAYVKMYPGRKSAQIVREYYDLLKSSDFHYTDKVDSFMLEKIYN
jgi:hypothetical protein